jgi:hypothetical protein
VLHIQPPQALVKLFITFKAYFSRYRLYLKPDDDATKAKTPHEVYHAIARDWDIDRNSSARLESVAFDDPRSAYSGIATKLVKLRRPAEGFDITAHNVVSTNNSGPASSRRFLEYASRCLEVSVGL